LGQAIKDKGWIYSWARTGTLGSDVSICGISGPFSLRQDCSGFVSACIAIYAMAMNEASSYSTCNETSLDYTNGNFKYKGLFEEAKSGDYAHVIYADNDGETGHTEASDETGQIWSGGGSGSCVGTAVV
jgi:hypothetical protein